MRPTSPAAEARRLYDTVRHTRADVYDTRQMLQSDLLHATVEGYGTSTPAAILTHFEAYMVLDGFNLDAGG